MKMTSSLSVIWKNVNVCAAPFVEHLQKEKKNLLSNYKRKKSKDIFADGFFSSILNMFVNKRKESVINIMFS